MSKEKRRNDLNRLRVYDWHRLTRPKNACKIGMIGNSLYVVTLSIVDGKEVLNIHTLKEKETDIIEYADQSIVRDLFRKMTF